MAPITSRNSAPDGSCLCRSCSGIGIEATYHPRDATDALHNGNSRCYQHAESQAIQDDQIHYLFKKQNNIIPFMQNCCNLSRVQPLYMADSPFVKKAVHQ